MNNIYLVGFMGTGKTEVARLLAKRLNRTFVDMDELIIARQKMPIRDIFQKKGEPYFRKLEKDLVSELVKKDNLIVACGGGTFVDPENIENLKKSGIVICLTSTPETILKRTSRFRHRPLLNGNDPRGRIEELLKKRMPFYAHAHYTIDGDKITVEETIEEILKIFEK